MIYHPGKHKKYSSRFIALIILLLLSAAGIASFIAYTHLGFTVSSSPEQIIQIPSHSRPDTTRQKRTSPGDTLFLWTVKNGDQLSSQKKYEPAIAEYEKALKMKPNDAALKEKMSRARTLLAEQKKADEDYQKAMASGDDYFGKKDYLNAKAAYQIAGALKPDDAAAKDKLKKTMDLLRSQKATNVLYDMAIASAEKLFQAKDYEKARVEFEKASQINPNDQYAKDRINECIKIMIDNKTREEMYGKSIETADKLYAAKNWQGALLEYKNASSIKPDEIYPKDRIRELTLLLKSQKEKDDAYNKSIAAADKLFKDESYPDARKEYQNASTIKPEQLYPKNRIKEIDDILAARKKADADYQRMVAAADSFYVSKDFIRAKAGYQQALTIKPAEAYPKEMISRVDQAMTGMEANAKALDDSYKAAVASADKLFGEKSWDQAKTEYQNASNIKPAEQYPKQKIAEIGKILADIASQKSLDEQYSSLIADADKLLGEKSYDQSKVKYQSALKIKPDEKYPKDKIAEIDLVLAGISKQKALEDQYQSLIKEGDKLLAAKTYAQARSKFSDASSLKPDEQYPKDKIAEIDKLLGDIAAQKDIDDRYQSIIAGADKLLAAKSYDQARTEYTNASSVKPDAQYPKDKIAEIDKALAALADQKAKDEQYQASIQKADKLFTGKSWEPAKTEYQSASGIKPAETYPKQKIGEIDKILADLAKQKSLDDQYSSLIADADKLLGEKSYDPARVKYQSALKIKPDEKYPKDKIAEIDLVLADISKQKALDDQYQALIKDGDRLLAAKTYDQARTKYTDAGSLKPSEQYPKDKIAEIDRLLGDIAAQKAIDEKYQSIIAGADKLLAAKSYDQARTEYANASSVKPDAQYPKDRIAEIDKALAALADQKAKDDLYKSSIEKADKLFTDKSWEPAKTEYQSASGIKPAETYPKQKIGEIDKILADLAKQKSLDDQYSSLIADADKLLGEKSYDPSKVKYQSALKIKPDEKYPKDKIAEIDLALADIAKQKALDGQYMATIKDADRLLAAKTYDQARTKYSDAGNLKPSEQYPKDKIAEIDKLLGDIAAQKALDEKYQSIIANADKLLAVKSYDQARTEYTNASSVKPDAQYPKDKIAEIDKALAAIAEQKATDEKYSASLGKADKLFADKSWEAAKSEYQAASGIKPAEIYPKQQIGEIDKILADLAKKKALDDQYSSLIGDGDKLLGEKSYDLGKAKYQAALALKPAETYPKDKIAEIDAALADIAKQKAIEDQYRSSIDKADKLLAEKSYDPAKAEYSNALKIKSAEQYPKDKIAEIDKALADIAKQKALDNQYLALIGDADKLMAAKTYDQARAKYTDAGTLKPAEQYPKDRIAAIDKILADIAHAKEVDDQYRASIAKADQLLLAKSLEPARTEYSNASLLKPDEQYPKSKIAEIDKVLNDRKALEEQYQASITKADQLLSDKSYDQAKAQYLTASRLKPAEQYPKDKISQIDKTLAEVAHQKAIDDQYSGSIAKAEKLYTDKSYEQARTEFGNASSIKPSEQYPKDKIAEIEALLADMKAKEDAYKASIAKADQFLAKKSYDDAKTEYQNAATIKPTATYPNDKIAEINKILTELLGKKKLFDDLVSKGDNFYGQKEFYKSKDQFQQALTLFPEDPYAKQRMVRVNSSIDSIYRANKGLYDKAVADGDKNYNTFIYDKAIDSYTEALSYLPMETYPKDMINKIKKVIAENAMVDVLNTPVTINSGEEKQFPFTPVSMASRKNNYVYVKIRNKSDKPFNVLLRYGKDKVTMGGAVIKNLVADGKVYDRLISIRDQDPWYRNDNNFLSIYPQGGDVEVTFIQISRAQ
jgi:tetratricopeptide (TPR) repeat protein